MTRNAALDLMIERAILMAEARHARDLRQSKRAAGLEAKLRKVQHRLMEMGHDQS